MIKKSLLLTLCCLLITAVTVRSQSIQDYVDEHTDYAQELMREYEVPASVILAVAIHESAAGKSKVARHLNNHFGIKGSNSSTAINSSYKDYGTAADSYTNFVEVLQNRSSFSKLFDLYDQYDYAGWARGIQRGGYASSRTWANQVIAIINKYQLYQYDDRPADYVEPIKVAPAVRKKSYIAKKRTRNNRSNSKMYTVRKGDNLNRIALSRGTTAKALMQKNGLKKSALKPGQKLRI